MGFARYFVFPLDRDWLVMLEGRIMARHDSRDDALAGATVMANLMGAMHYDADVMVDRGDGQPLELVWVYGRDAIEHRPQRKRLRGRKIGRLHQLQRAEQPAAGVL